MSEEQPLAFRILQDLHRSSAISQEELGEIYAKYSADEIDEAMRGLAAVQLVKIIRYPHFLTGEPLEEHHARNSPLWRFLSTEAGEFTQKSMGEALGVSQPIVSRRLKILLELGLVVVARTEGVARTGGRRTLYRRV
jgi:DNA-binding transcriptional ArsR family regulator